MSLFFKVIGLLEYTVEDGNLKFGAVLIWLSLLRAKFGKSIARCTWKGCCSQQLAWIILHLRENFNVKLGS